MRIVLLGSLIFFMGGSPLLWACHQGGPMGFARHSPGGFSLDVSSSTIFPTASTSGTSGCKNWDFSLEQTNRYVAVEWESLSEEAAQGQGPHLVALSGLMECPTSQAPAFEKLIQQNYLTLFQPGNPSPRSPALPAFLPRLQALLVHSSLTCASPLLADQFLNNAVLK